MRPKQVRSLARRALGIEDRDHWHLACRHERGACRIFLTTRSTPRTHASTVELDSATTWATLARRMLASAKP